MKLGGRIGNWAAISISGIGLLAAIFPAHAGSANLVATTDQALVDQMRCQDAPAAARAVNAMLKNHLVRYTDNESGVYLFTATAPLTIFGLPVKSVSGFDYHNFKGVPPSTMAGTAPPVFLQLDVVASVDELRNRALKAGLVQAVPHLHERGFEISAGASYLAPKSRAVVSNIKCEVYP